MDDIILASNVSRSFGNVQALKGLDLAVRRGEFLVILGPNGAGKTTLIKILSTLSRPSGGSVMIDGMDATTDAVQIRQMIGVLSHDSYLYNDLTAEENLRFFGKMYGLADDVLERRIDELLEKVELFHRAGDRVGTLSRGMKQRLSIARALIHNPSILLLDEPYTGLDQHAAQTFEKVLLELDPSKTTRVMISHNIERSLRSCDRVVIMVRGKVVYDSPRSDIGSVEELKETYIALVDGERDA
ncbi:MAG: ABC transporter ATP-binding protein [Methanosarcinaceae archaeon]|nr:ABC transporter ATP-binding protein [Methanosarcinaceae archaeon]